MVRSSLLFLVRDGTQIPIVLHLQEGNVGCRWKVSERANGMKRLIRFLDTTHGLQIIRLVDVDIILRAAKGCWRSVDLCY